MLEEAIRIGERISNELEASPDLMQLQGRMAEWHLRLGHKEKSIRIYEKLTDNMDEKEALIRTLNSKISKTSESFKIIEQTSKEQTVSESTDTNGQNTIDRFLHKVDDLLQRHAYNEARILLIKRRIKIEEGPEIEIIDQALNKVGLEEERYEREKEARNSQRKAALETVRNMIEEEKFEEAITKIEEINQTHEINAEIEALKEHAIEKLINRERNRAAKLFLEAKKTQDTLKKEEYFRSSYEILKALIEKYPSSPLNKKLESHISRVREEMDKLGISSEK
jgi:hypothetical protein